MMATIGHIRPSDVISFSIELYFLSSIARLLLTMVAKTASIVISGCPQHRNKLKI
jgi:hypothetical protein